MNLCHNLANIMATYIMILVTSMLSLKGVMSFILVFEIVQQGHIMLNL